MAPADRAATPASTMAPLSLVALAKPTTTPAVDTMPSLAPRTPARSQLRRLAVLDACGSARAGVGAGGGGAAGARAAALKRGPVGGGGGFGRGARPGRGGPPG